MEVVWFLIMDPWKTCVSIIISGRRRLRLGLSKRVLGKVSSGSFFVIFFSSRLILP